MADETFEQQVAEALLIEIKHHTEAFFGLGGDPTPAERYLAEHLAPRVAAAIRAAAEAADNECQDSWEQSSKAALATLRGADA